jgi:hypothetical protein
MERAKEKASKANIGYGSSLRFLKKIKGALFSFVFDRERFHS